MMCRQAIPFVTAIAAVALIVATPVAAQQDHPKTRARSQQTQPTVAPAESPALRLQVWLDRAGFSPGEIDGHHGLNTTRALQAFAEAHRLEAADEAAIVRALSEDTAPVVTTYAITAADAAGPFTPDIPSDLEQQATLPALNYSSLDEAIGEKFHASPALLKALNSGVELEEGTEIQVPERSCGRGSRRGHGARRQGCGLAQPIGGSGV